MPWIRSGDNAATYPPMMSVAGDPDADERTVNEVFGWLLRCAFQSGAHLTDYVLDLGTARMLGGSRTDELVRLCVDAGVLTPRTNDKGHPAWTMVADPEFVHIRLRQEVEWERQQRNDTRDPGLVVPVRLRDGDNCRWCGVLVQRRGKRTNRTSTIDHLEPGKPGTVETMVVACHGCNSGRGANRELWDENHTLRPAPHVPRYGKWTAKELTDNGYPVDVNVSSDDAAPQAAADPAPGTAGVRPAAPAAADPARRQAVRPAAPPAARRQQSKPSTAPPKSRPKSTSKVDRSSSPGSGRDGSVTGSGTARGGSPSAARRDAGTPSGDARPAQPQDQPPRSSRRRRGKRGGRRSHRGGTPS